MTSGISWARLIFRACAATFIFVLFSVPAGAGQGPPDLTLFFSSDTRGMLRRCGCSEGQLGGLSARASFIKRNANPARTLVLDAGDTLFDGPSCEPEKRDFNLLKARTLIAAMRQAGYDAAAVGEYDLSCGPAFLSAAFKGAGFPLIAANVEVKKGGKGVHPFRAGIIRAFPGFKVAVIGVLDSEFPYGSFRESFGDITVTDAAVAANAEIKKARGKAGLVIVLAHLGIEDAERFASSLNGADIVVQGHSQEVLDRPLAAGGALIVKGFYKGKRIGRLDLWLSGKGRKQVSDYKYSVINLDESVPPDQEVESIIAGYRKELKKRAFVFARPDPEGKGRFTGAGKCRGCHPVQYNNWSGTAHAAAYGSLIRTGDQYDPECLPCHTTGYGFVSGYRTETESKGLMAVTCEACHGRGEAHALAGKGISRKVKEDVCLSCHDEYNSPNFQYERYKELGGAHRGHKINGP